MIEPVRLLISDIRQYFHRENIERAHTCDILTHLVCLEDRPWGKINRGLSMSAHMMASLLEPFCIYSRQLKINGVNRNGYKRESFISCKTEEMIMKKETKKRPLYECFIELFEDFKAAVSEFSDCKSSALGLSKKELQKLFDCMKKFEPNWERLKPHSDFLIKEKGRIERKYSPEGFWQGFSEYASSKGDSRKKIDEIKANCDLSQIEISVSNPILAKYLTYLKDDLI